MVEELDTSEKQRRAKSKMILALAGSPTQAHENVLSIPP